LISAVHHVAVRIAPTLSDFAALACSVIDRPELLHAFIEPFLKGMSDCNRRRSRKDRQERQESKDRIF